MSIYLGIDSGTQGVKVVALDLERRRVIAGARVPHRLIPGLPPGHLEQHPEEWIVAMDRALRRVLGKIERQRVRGIGVSGQQHGLVPLDAQGSVIRPAKLWCDTSTTAECEQLTRKLGGSAAVLRATGNLFLPGYTAPKILWLKRNEPTNYRRLRHVLLPHDYLNFHLTGRYTMEPGDASGTALYDVRRRAWSPNAIRAVDPSLADWLPPVTGSHRPAGELRPEMRRSYRLPPGVIVSAGGGDNMMGAIGTGNVRPGVVTASLGTSGTIYAYSRKPVVDSSGEIAAFCSSTGGWLPLLCTMNVTSLTERVRALFRFRHAALEAAAGRVEPGAGGIVLLPYLAGERTPNLPDARGVVFGIDHGNFTAAHLARAALEGIALGLNYGLGRLRQLGVQPREIRVTGGGARSSLWRQILADVFGVPVVGLATDEAAALGAALQAAWCTDRPTQRHLGELADSVVSLDERTRCEPRSASHARYRELQERHDTLSLALLPLFRSDQFAAPK